MTKTITGGCHCGAVRYEVNADPIMACHCQCLDCQKASGAGHASLMMVPAAAATVTGSPRFFATQSDSGNTVERGFCATCGSTVMGKSSGFPQGVVLYAGTLDEPSQFVPQFTVYGKRGHAWDVMDPALPRFETMPPR